MSRCDVCGRAVLLVDATTFPNNDVVICRRRECVSVAEKAKDHYYNDEIDNVKRVMGI